MIKRLVNTLIGMLFYMIVAYGGNLVTGLAKHANFWSVLGESLFFGMFVFLFQQFRLKEDEKNDSSQ